MPGSADTPNERDIGVNDPVDWKLDDNGELIFPIQWTRGSAAVAQRVRIKFKMTRGEWYANGDAGFPYLANDFVTEAQAIMEDAFDRTKAEAIFRREALAVIGVSRVVSLSVDFDPGDRELDVAAEIVTIYGDPITVRTAVLLS